MSTPKLRLEGTLEDEGQSARPWIAMYSFGYPLLQ